MNQFREESLIKAKNIFYGEESKRNIIYSKIRNRNYYANNISSVNSNDNIVVAARLTLKKIY